MHVSIQTNIVTHVQSQSYNPNKHSYMTVSFSPQSAHTLKKVKASSFFAKVMAVALPAFAALANIAVASLAAGSSWEVGASPASDR
jgi:hypothetical protein